MAEERVTQQALQQRVGNGAWLDILLGVCKASESGVYGVG